MRPDRPRSFLISWANVQRRADSTWRLHSNDREQLFRSASLIIHPGVLLQLSRVDMITEGYD